MKRARKAPSRKSKPKRSKHSAGSKSTAFEGSPPRIGAEATFEAVIPHDWTIQALHPDLPPVLSTPRMIQMMEHASTRAVLPELPPGTISVGTRIEVDHLKAVPNGTKVAAHAKLVGYKGRFLVFDVEARSGEIVIGRGKVFRAIVQAGQHGEKARARVSDGSSGRA